MDRDKEPKITIENWDEYYKKTPTGELPWYTEGADAEVLEAINEYCPASGDILDLGTGPGTMAIEFSRRGYDVTAADISESALETARERAGLYAASISFIKDDIRDSRLSGPFDIVHDRGCFHVMRGSERRLYAETLTGLMKSGSTLLLKTFSSNEPGTEGPERYSIDDIVGFFQPLGFDLLHATETFFPSTMERDPVAIFCVLRFNGHQ